MKASRWRYAGADEGGFSLVELMIVVLIIGILISIGLPTFLGAKSRAADKAAQSELRTGLAAALTYYAQAGNWDGFDATEAELAESSLEWLDGGDPPAEEISIQVHSNQDLLLVRESMSGSFFCVAQIRSNPATLRGKGSTFADIDTIPECSNGW
jgi:type IV pilus assembly protein PilA